MVSEKRLPPSVFMMSAVHFIQRHVITKNIPIIGCDEENIQRLSLHKILVVLVRCQNASRRKCLRQVPVFVIAVSIFFDIVHYR